MNPKYTRLTSLSFGFLVGTHILFPHQMESAYYTDPVWLQLQMALSPSTHLPHQHGEPQALSSAQYFASATASTHI